jgi:23S rRNA U2552 (ribose-2'-O)-methylase RlmE/FtsJ
LFFLLLCEFFATILFYSSINTMTSCETVQSTYTQRYERIKHFIPDLILQTTTSARTRVVACVTERYVPASNHCPPTVIPTESVPNQVFIQFEAPKLKNRDGFLAWLITQPILLRNIQFVHAVDGIAFDLADLYKRLASVTVATTGDCKQTFRFVSNCENTAEVCNALVEHGISLHPKQFTHTLHVAKAYNRYHFGTLPRALYDTMIRAQHPEQYNSKYRECAPVSRAYYKLREACTEYPPSSTVFQQMLRNASEKKRVLHAVDIGAAPGGWSQVLAELGVHTLALDPAVLSVDKMPTSVSKFITHIKAKAQSDLPELKQFCPLDMVVCDMNIHPNACAKIIENFTDHCRPGALLVLTFKMTQGRSVRKAAESEAINSLSPHFEDFHHTHLLSNSSGERTIIARRRCKQ